jgi:hypothetical protein
VTIIVVSPARNYAGDEFTLRVKAYLVFIAVEVFRLLLFAMFCLDLPPRVIPLLKSLPSSI